MLFPNIENVELSIEEYKRYSRHIVLAEVGVLGQKRIKAAKVLIVGIGGLGNFAMIALAAAGIGRLGVVDYDIVSLSNLQRQTLYNTEHINFRKVEASKIQIHKLNINCEVVIYDTKINFNNASKILSEYDIIVDASDNFFTRYLLNDISILFNKPLIYGAILKTFGHVTVFNYKGGPTYRDLYPEEPSENLLTSCSEGGIFCGVASIISSFQSNEVLKIILGLDDVLSGQMVVYDFSKVALNRISIIRYPHFTRAFIANNTSSLAYFVRDNIFLNDLLKEKEVNCGEIEKLLLSNTCLFIDVRTFQEYNVFHLPGAKNIPISSIVDFENLCFFRKNIDDGNRIVLYCQSNSRSLAAVVMLSKLKIQVSRLKGGIFML
nr:moeB [Porphyropsis coccinea]